jgi:predicted permease
MVAGILPAWIGTRLNAEHSLRVTEQGGTQTRSARAATRGLLIGEIALACTLLVGATLLVRSFINLAQAERGLDAGGVLTAWMSLPQSAFPDPASRGAAARSLEEQIRGLPGIDRVAWSYGVPPDGGSFSFGNWTSDAPGTPVVDMEVDRYDVGPEFFALYGIPLLKGRAFLSYDAEGAVVVGERLARTLWPGIDPIGRTFTFQKERFHVIGVVREIHHPSLDPSRDRPEFYEPFMGVGSNAMVSLRCNRSCPDAALVRKRIIDTHPAVRINDVGPLEDAYFEQLARPRAAAALGFTFAAIAAVAAASGLFSVLSYTVGRRRREFGIRAALGASRSHIRRLVLRDGLIVVLIGVAIGAAGAWSLARALASLQYGTTMTDPFSCVIVLSLLGFTTIAASWRPAREAMRADPALLLREE